MKTLIVVMLVAIVLVLGSAGIAMLRRPRDGERNNARMARALALRVGLSIALFLFILLAWRLGWIQPSGLPLSR
jgi:Protein of unknown function (DUF2909)